MTVCTHPCASGQLLVHRRHGGLDAPRLIPGGVLLLELLHEQLGRFVGGGALLLERGDARLQRLEIAAIPVDGRAVGELVMGRHELRRLQRRYLVEARQPGAAVRLRRGECREEVLHRQVAGKQHPIALDERHRITARVARSQPDQADADAAQIEYFLLLENLRGRAERDLLEQVGNLRRPLPEALHKLHAHLVDILLLRGGADDLGTRRERDFAGGVLGMKMRVDNVEVGTLAHLLHFAQHDLAVLQPHAGIDHQRRPAADEMMPTLGTMATLKSGMT